MVDFTKAMSNQHMIDGLNRVIEMNYRLIRHCDWAYKHAAGPDLKGMAEQLRSMHHGHIEMISEMVRALGGVPASGDGPSPNDHFGVGGHNEQAIMISLREEEDELQRHYVETLKALGASGEVADVMNRTIDDARKQHEALEVH
ncbi:hypothetical protein RE428_23310 [Marinobacter nanhaiticus D15-8W]|uniref:DUF2383 domain-containing protein n=1 Tax=Marinobacter nanhaiticus D15-8W TaxID=626887 RepID=N6WQS2_9GAMM|nr:hypothetical protein [Marinobacter nanhaiticus]ENO13936.1 hypothetical protein J057_21110 [Marinobacter nanhaiticus D15-8W]BES71313.1 hypothetical protein RE428_23310 [Marinobacter nanhaiticus D15-8W]